MLAKHALNLFAQERMRYGSPVVRFRKNIGQAIVNGSLPPHRKKCSTQVHLEQNQRHEQHQARGSLCNCSSHVGKKYSVIADACVRARLVGLLDKRFWPGFQLRGVCVNQALAVQPAITPVFTSFILFRRNRD
jgi:hypothetical protein